jgi:flap endonuclease-1
MGIKNLQKLIDTKAPNAVKKVTTEQLKGLTLAIDTSLMVHQVVTAIRSNGTNFTDDEGNTTTHIVGIFNKVKWFLEHKITPIFVFDGKPPSIKMATLQERKERIDKAAKLIAEISDGEENEKEKIKLSQQTYVFTETHAKQIKELLTAIGVPWVDAPEEADSVCAQLVKSGLAWGVISNDRDILTFGCERLLYNFKTGDKEHPMINLTTLLTELKLNQTQFIDLCILLESDYTPKIKGIGPNKAYDIIAEFKSINAFLISTKGKKVKLPDEFNYEAAQEYFKNPPGIKITSKTKLELSKPNWGLVHELLVDRYNFDAAVITKQIMKLQK